MGSSLSYNNIYDYIIYMIYIASIASLSPGGGQDHVSANKMLSQHKQFPLALYGEMFTALKTKILL